MSYVSLPVVALLAVLLGVAPVTSAAIPEVMDYQGYLTDTGGVPVSGTHTLTVGLYATATGGAPLWSQTSAVTVQDGRFALLLDGRAGSGNPFPAGLFGQALHAGVAIDGAPELNPRTQLTATPYSFKAADADTVGGLTAAQLSAAGAAVASYVGASATDPGGDKGQLAMNAACQNTYPGSRMCTSQEILSQTTPLTITKPQHVHPSLVALTGTGTGLEALDYSGRKALFNSLVCGSPSNGPWGSRGAGLTGLGLVPGAVRLTLIDCGDNTDGAVACCLGD